LFKRQHIPIYLVGIAPILGKDKQGEQVLETLLDFRIHPITPELATELDPLVRSTLWSLGKVDVQEKVKSITFELGLPAFAIAFRPAPDLAHASIEVPYARLDKGQILAKKHKDVAGWAITYSVRIPTPDAESLALMHHGYSKQHFLTFTPAAPDLIDAMEVPEGQRPPTSNRKGRGKEAAANDVH
jgi:hypothetical protein